MKEPKHSWAIMGERFQPNGGHGQQRLAIRNMPSAAGGSARDQKKLVRSMVVPQRVPGGKVAMRAPMSCKDGNLKRGSGSGERVLTPRKSAIKQAFSVLLGRRNALALGPMSGKFSGSGTRNPSLLSAFRSVCVMLLGALTVKGARGMKALSSVTNWCGT